jgi:integrase
MASIQKRNSSYRARIKRTGKSTISQTFLTRNEALQWVKETQAMVDLGLYEAAPIRSLKTFSQAAICYRDTHSIHKKIVRSETYRLHILIKRWGNLPIEEVNKAAILDLRDDLLSSGRSGDTINHYFNTLSKLFQMLNNEWDLDIANPIKGIKRMPPSKGRTKRIHGAIEQQLLNSCERLSLPLLGSIIQFAIQTGMRRGELMGLTWADIDLPNRKAYLHCTKNGDPRQVPLSQAAIAAINSLPQDRSGKVFPMSLGQLRTQFERVCNHSKSEFKPVGMNPFEDLRFHDLRHEALSRLSDAGLNVIELSHVSGHRTLGMLKRYVHCSHQAILEKVNAAKSSETNSQNSSAQST